MATAQIQHSKLFPDEPGRQAHYQRMIEAGESERMAEMLAAQQPPGLGLTTASFLRGRRDGGLSNPEVNAHYRKIALEAGVNPHGQVYSSPLASYPGDPDAWISTPDEAKAVAERKGLKLEGGISYTASRYEAPVGDENVDFSTKEYEVAPDIVSDEMEMQAASNPELLTEWKSKPKVFEEAKETTKARLSGRD